MNMRISSVSWAVLLLLAACGGGGGDSGDPLSPSATPLALTTANYQAVAQESVSSANFLVSTAEIVTGAQFASDRVLLAFARAQAAKLARWFGTAPKWVVGATLTQTEACSGGGSLTVSVDDKNGNQDLDAGESATIVAAQCVEAGASMNGSIAMTVNTLTGDASGDVYAMSVSMTLTSLTATLSGGTVSGSGAMGIDFAFSAANAGTVALTVDSLSVSGTFNNVAYTRSLKDFKISETRTASGFGYMSSSLVSGTFSSSGLESKTVTLSTVQAIVQQSSSDYPSSGQILATGLNGSKARITVQSESSVLIELDANGDNAYEESVAKPWNELL
jgi:hypothetical protein